MSIYLGYLETRQVGNSAEKMNEKVKVTFKKPEAKRNNPVSKVQKSDFSKSITSPADHILFLQRTIGNQAVQRLFTTGTIQAKFRIGQPNDIYEQEADQVAEQVVRMPESQVQQQPLAEEEEIPAKPLANQITSLVHVQRQEEPEEEEATQSKPLADQITPMVQRQPEPVEEEEKQIQPKSNIGMAPQVTPGVVHDIHSFKGTGQPLSTSERAFFEPRFGVDFGNVRVHTNERAARTAQTINARAFTLGSDVVFGVGQYSPGSRSGRSLFAHELTHVVQQNGVVPGSRKRVGSPLSTLSPPVSTSIQRYDPKKYKQSTYTMIDFSKPRKNVYLAHLINKKKVTDSMIMETEQFRYMIRWRVPWRRAILACRMILADVKRGVTVTAAETWKYIRKARDKIHQGPRRGGGWGFKEKGVAGSVFWLVNFSYNKENLKKGHYSYLDKSIAPYLKTLKKQANKTTIKLIGRASQSGRGTKRWFRNWVLSNQRAKNVKNYLTSVLLSIKYPFKFKIIPAGATKPVDKSKAENYLDRSVQIVIYPPLEAKKSSKSIVPSPPPVDWNKFFSESHDHCCWNRGFKQVGLAAACAFLDITYCMAYHALPKTLHSR